MYDGWCAVFYTTDTYITIYYRTILFHDWMSRISSVIYNFDFINIWQWFSIRILQLKFESL